MCSFYVEGFAIKFYLNDRLKKSGKHQQPLFAPDEALFVQSPLTNSRKEKASRKSFPIP